MEDDHGSAGLTDSSYQSVSAHTAEDSDDLDSLPSTSATSTEVSPSEDGHYNDAEREWRESLQQLELLLTLTLIPYIGKYFGRRFAYWGWAKFMEWKYPVTIEISNPRLFKGAGLVEAAATL